MVSNNTAQSSNHDFLSTGIPCFSRKLTGTSVLTTTIVSILSQVGSGRTRWAPFSPRAPSPSSDRSAASKGQNRGPALRPISKGTFSSPVCSHSIWKPPPPSAILRHPQRHNPLQHAAAARPGRFSPASAVRSRTTASAEVNAAPTTTRSLSAPERSVFGRRLSSAKTQRHSCSAGQEAVLVVKSVQDGVCHNSA